jgi:hypothetical protein
MADNDRSKIRYDDFIGHVQPDPAQPVSTIMLSGFVGHGPEGHARVYPDPTLGSWYDIPEDDIVHSMPIPDSRLGGSYVWARAGAQIKPGSAAGAAAPEAVAAPAAPAAAGGPLHTHFLCTQGIATFCGCTPGIHCMTPPGGLQTKAPICTQGLATFCGCTPGFACLAQAAPQQAPLQPTPASDCFFCLPPTLDGLCGARAMAVAKYPDTAAQCVLPETRQTPCPGWQGTAVCTMVCWTQAFCPPPAVTTVCPTQVLCAANGVFTPFGR